jgi:hypothetical protein
MHLILLTLPFSWDLRSLPIAAFVVQREYIPHCILRSFPLQVPAPWYLIRKSICNFLHLKAVTLAVNSGEFADKGVTLASSESLHFQENVRCT